jgi:hypothetical protein
MTDFSPSKGIEAINVRFFALVDTDEGQDIEEVGEAEFLEAEGVISYERHTVFENGCRQICLTKMPEG